MQSDCGATSGGGPDRPAASDRDRFRAVFRAEPGAVRDTLRAAVARFARRLSEEEAGTLEIVLAEVLNNVAEHGYAGLPVGSVELDLAHEPAALRCRIVDEGRPMPNLTLPDGRIQPIAGTVEDLAEGGWGWALIRALTTDLVYTRSDGRNELCFRLALGVA